MARPASPRPTDGELAILQVLWKSGGSSIRQIQDALRHSRPMGYTTVQTNLKTMIAKRLVLRRQAQGAVIYAPAISQEATQRQLLRELAKRVFGGSMQQLIDQAHAMQRPSDSPRQRKRV